MEPLDAAGSGVAADAVSEVHERLRRAIIEGELPAGADIARVQLVRDFGVGETPLREALRMLQREGLIEARAHRRIRIAPVSVSDLEELYCLRIVNEAFAMRLTVPRMDHEDIASLEGDLAQMNHFARFEDFAAWEKPHRHFHARLIAGGGRRVVALCAQLSDHASRYRHIFVSGQRGWNLAARDHRRIVDACAEGKVEEAVRALVDHYATTALSVIGSIDEAYAPDRLKTIVDQERPGSFNISP